MSKFDIWNIINADTEKVKSIKNQSKDKDFDKYVDNDIKKRCEKTITSAVDTIVNVFKIINAK